MKRKINRVGQNTLTVSLPSSWARMLNLKPGEEIDVDEKGHSLIVSRGRVPEKKEVTVHLTDKDHFAKRLLGMPYIQGYDVIRVTYNDPEVYPLVRDCVNRIMLGFEIIDHGKDACVLKNIAEGIDSEFESNQRKFILQVKNIIENLKEAVEKKDDSLIEHIMMLDQSIDKLCVFMRRILVMKGYRDDSRGKSYYYIVNLLETISDRCRDVCKHIKESGKFPSKNVLAIINEVKKSFETFYDLYYKPEINKVIVLKKHYSKVKPKIYEMMSKNPNEAIPLHHLLGVLEIIQSMSEEMECPA
ncbi:TPA: phosphate uptake regulator PhoU [Candidatus Woesearchaeota archaeon]|nr:phosphate uptake regulator PhoU [Candidatus Woesearchaeota archaeon]